MKTTIQVGLLTVLLTSAGFCFGGVPRCSCLHVEVTNATGKECVLTSQKVVHGGLFASKPANSILPNEMKTFTMTQTFKGSEIVLSYQCGDDNITFVSKQELSMLTAGDVSGSIVPPPPPHISATREIVKGSCVRSRHGLIKWKISPKP